MVNIMENVLGGTADWKLQAQENGLRHGFYKKYSISGNILEEEYENR